MRAIARILVSFCSLLMAVGIFSVILGAVGSWLLIFKVAMFFALPVWLINLPILFLFRKATCQGWIVPALGGFIGPACLTLWCAILVLRGSNWANLWNGDSEAGGLGSSLIFAFLIGLGTNTFYMLALRIFERQIDRKDPHAPHDDEQGADTPTR